MHPPRKIRALDKKQLKHGRFTVDFYVNNKFDPPIYHYIITANNRPEILSWGQERSMTAAELEARRCMEEYEAREAG